MARAIKRLYEIKGVSRSGGKPIHGEEVKSEIANETGLSEKQVSVNRTLADLIPELSAMLGSKAIKRLYEIRGIKDGDTTSSFTVKDLADEVGKSEATVSRLRTLADLIPELSAMLGSKAIKRLYEIRGIDGAGSRGDITGATVAQVANEFKRGWQTVR